MKKGPSGPLVFGGLSGSPQHCKRYFYDQHPEQSIDQEDGSEAHYNPLTCQRMHAAQ